MTYMVEKNGRVQIQILNPDKPKKSYSYRQDQLEAGRKRKAIEDRKIQKTLMEGDLW